MIDNKHLSKFIIVLMAAAVCFCFIFCLFSDKLDAIFGGKGVSQEYEYELFDTSEIITVDIKMDEEDWNALLTNAMSEEYAVCDVVVNGTKFKNVAIRPKGNTSLSAIAMDQNTDRYSLKLEFDHFVEEQTCFGLDKLILNNNYADATNMKEAIIYDMFQYIGADASLYNYAKVSVNGEYWGVYLALEGVEESFMLRNYGSQDGELYKPESLGMGGGDDDSSKKDRGGDISQDKKQDKKAGKDSKKDASTEDIKDASGFGGGFDQNSMPGGGGGFSMGGGGANLNYTNDDLDSYSTIWEGSVTDTTKSDHRRVVTALKNINEGTDLETYLDMDNILKFMAVHTFAVNMDSLSGSMAHNYYLYEYEGQLNMLPWDYNLSLGGMSMGGGSASDMINDAIDTPFSGTNFFDKILENEEYNQKYHEYLNILVEEYVNGGRFDEVYQRIRSQIDELVSTDPTAFYSESEYQVAADMLYKTITLRAESIKGQLNGDIPSTDNGQRQNSSALIDASEIDIKAMGQFSMGGFGGGGFGDSGQMSQPPSFGGGKDFGDMDFSNMDFDNMDFDNMDFSNMDFDNMDFSNMDFDNMDFDKNSFGGAPFSGTSGPGNSIKGVIALAGCFIAMIIGFIVVKVYKRKWKVK